MPCQFVMGGTLAFLRYKVKMKPGRQTSEMTGLRETVRNVD